MEEGWSFCFLNPRAVGLGCPNTDGTSLDCCTGGDASDVATTSSQGKGVSTSSTSEGGCADGGSWRMAFTKLKLLLLFFFFQSGLPLF